MPRTIPINITWTQANGYSMSPASPQIDKQGTAQFNAPTQGATVCFNPTTTPFGDHIDIPQGGQVDIQVGDSNYSVGYCITTYGSTCTAPAPPPPTVLNTSGTIKVGSG